MQSIKMGLEKITDVVSELNNILAKCKVTRNKAGYFAALYKRMTVAVSEGILNGSFQDGERMERLDVCFAGRYLSAWKAYGEKQDCTHSWQYAFDGCSNENLTVVQHLILGINTHINLDLAIAAALTAPGEKIYALEADFNHINIVIAALVDDIQQCLEEVWAPMRLLKKIANGREAAVLNFSIDAARKTAWANAVLLAHMDEAGQKAHIAQMDKMVLGLAGKIINPGPGPSFLLKLVKWTEYNDIAKTIDLIDTTRVD